MNCEYFIQIKTQQVLLVVALAQMLLPTVPSHEFCLPSKLKM